MVTYGRLKTKKNSKLSALKVVAVAYERWSLAIGSKYSDLTGKQLVSWKSLRRGGRLREVVTTGGSTVCDKRIENPFYSESRITLKSVGKRVCNVPRDVSG